MIHRFFIHNILHFLQFRSAILCRRVVVGSGCGDGDEKMAAAEMMLLMLLLLLLQQRLFVT